MAIQFIKATASNLRMGKLVARYSRVNGETKIHGPIMYVGNRTRKEIVETGKVWCIKMEEDGERTSEEVLLSDLAQVIDYKLTRKIKPEEKFGQ